MTIREIAETLDATWLCCGGRRPGASHGLRIRHDERRAGLRDGRYAAAHRPGERPMRAHLRNAGCAVRGLRAQQKEPLADALALAREINLPMLKTPYTMFEACARLYTAGLRPVELG